jgi:hypothetical protein
MDSRQIQLECLMNLELCRPAQGNSGRGGRSDLDSGSKVLRLDHGCSRSPRILFSSLILQFLNQALCNSSTADNDRTESVYTQREMVICIIQMS